MYDRKYDFAELKEMDEFSLKQVLESFHPLKVPVSAKEGYYFYFRQFPSQELDGKVAKPKKRVYNPSFSLNLNKKPVQSGVDIKASKIKTYDNPYTTHVPTPDETFEKATNKILNQFPANRSLLVVNYTKAYEDAFIKSLFQINGKVRRVFSQRLVKVNATDKKKRTLYFNIVVFKDYLSLLRCFDLRQFQWRVLTKFSQDFERRSDIEKEKLFGDYIQSIQDYINVEVDTPMYYEDQVDEFMPVLSGNYVKYADKWADYKKKKVKEVIKPGYYEFDAQNVNEDNEQGDDEEAEAGDFDERKLANPDYLEKRKSILKKTFDQSKRTKLN